MSNIPNFVNFPTENDYRNYFINQYCNNEITTFDGIKVEFNIQQFEHAFYESSLKNGIKDLFSKDRATRIDWIKYALENKDNNIDLYKGYDKRKKNYTINRRVHFIDSEVYVVVILLTSATTAKFLTAYYADSPNTANNIRNSQKW